LLIADDDPGLRESLERTLTREGYRVVLASDGRAALERVQAGGIDLIVTDLRMPGLTGLDLLRAAKAIMPDVDVILLTAFGTVEEAVKAMKDGAYDFLTKPFRREQLMARSIHERSARRSGPFVAVNCAALPETLLESELFGYEKGAFTGAGSRKEGRFDLANGGTLFLDEVADLSLVTQPKILRVLQEGEFERLGGTRTL